MTDTNPAFRLLRVVEEAKRLKTGLVWQVWAKAAGVEEPDQTASIRVMASIIEMLEEVEGLLRDREALNPDLYDAPFNKLRKLLSLTEINNDWRTRNQFLTDDVLLALRFASAELSRTDGEAEVDGQDLDEVREQIDSLSERLRDSDINQELKEILWDQLEVMRRAISEYWIRGAQGLRRAVAANIGLLILNRDKLEPAEELSAIWRIIERVNTLASTAINAHQLSIPTINALRQLGLG